MREQEYQMTPEARTAAFFEQDPHTIRGQLVEGEGMVIAVLGTDIKLRVTDAQPFSKKDVDPKYRRMNDLKPGDLYAPPQRQILQSLIVAKDQDGVGACVRLLKAEYFDTTSGTFVPELRAGVNIFKGLEGDIARFLNLSRHLNESLSFQDSSNTLYIKRECATVNQIPSSDANHQLRGLLNGGSQ